MRSKFTLRIWNTLVMLTMLVFAGTLVLIYYGPIFHTDMPVIFWAASVFVYVYLLLFMIVGELRTKAIKVFLHKYELSKSSFLGFGKTTKYNYEDFDGYLISDVRSRYGSYEYLYLIVNGKKTVKLSEYYHKNYEKLKEYLFNTDIPDLGYEEASPLRDAKELFD